MIISLKRLEQIYDSLNFSESVSLNRVIENNILKFVDVSDEEFKILARQVVQEVAQSEKIQEVAQESAQPEKIQEVAQSEKLSKILLNNLEKLDSETLERLTELTKNNTQFNTTIKNIPVAPPSAYSSTSLGLIGEAVVEQKFKDLGFDVFNSAERHHTGDLNILFDDFTILVEIKNKQRITKEDVEKFKYDIEYLETLDSKKVYGLFVSLKTDNVGGMSLPKINVLRSYVSADEIMNNSFLKSYVSTIELIHGLKRKADVGEIESVLKLNETMLKNVSEIINKQNEVLADSFNTKCDLEAQQSMLKEILGDCLPELRDEELVKQKLKKYVSGKKWSLKEAKQIIGDLAEVKSKKDVLDFVGL